MLRARTLERMLMEMLDTKVLEILDSPLGSALSDRASSLSFKLKDYDCYGLLRAVRTLSFINSLYPYYKKGTLNRGELEELIITYDNAQPWYDAGSPRLDNKSWLDTHCVPTLQLALEHRDTITTRYTGEFLDLMRAIILHDAIENNPGVVMYDTIKVAFNEKVADMVKLLTKDGLSSTEIERYLLQADPALHDMMEAAEELYQESEGFDKEAYKRSIAASQKSYETLEKAKEQYPEYIWLGAQYIRILDRLHNMRTIQNHKSWNQIRIAADTPGKYVLMAKELELSNIADELRDRSLETLERNLPLERYNDVVGDIGMPYSIAEAA